jgi:hypothetical protein
MPAKKTKAKPAEPEKKPVEENSPVVVAPPQMINGSVVVEPPPAETKPPEKDTAMVKEGELASAIADLAKVVESPKDPAEIKPPVIENKTFEPVGITVEPNPQPEVKAAAEAKPELPKEKKGGQGLWVIVAFLIGLGAGVLLGYWLWGRGTTAGTSQKPTEKQVENISPTKVPAEPTPQAEKVDRGKLKIQVLNGTGGKGVAAKAKGELESMGYKDVDTGNADREDYKQTEIALKSSSKIYFETLRADLSSKYQVASEASALAAGSTYDAIVTIGEK